MMRIIIFLMLIGASGCYRDNEEQLYGGGTSSCDTSHVTYSASVTTILQNNGCISCHSGGAPSGGISLQTYSGVKTVALNGKLYGAINHSAGFSPMPQNGNKLTPCAILQVKTWIDKGAPNN